ncbi:hypothetical protein BC332_25496 [Capsicum chinense]|nr:hypothetical protein BC332_25496 [Capsicum chinense]
MVYFRDLASSSEPRYLIISVTKIVSRPPKTWMLCSPNHQTKNIARVFRVACHLASGQRVSLAVLVLASIYRGLNVISECPWLDLVWSKEFVEEIKEPLHEEEQEEQMALPPRQVPNKRLSEDESASIHGDHCWKKVRPSLEEPPNANLHVLEIFGDNISSSRTLIAIKEPRNVNILDAPHCGRPQASEKSVARPDSIKVRSALKFEVKVTSTPSVKAKASTDSDFHKQLAISITSTVINKAVEIKKSKSYIKAKEPLELVMKERGEKSEELSVVCQSLEKERNKVKKLKALQDATKEEAKEIKSKVSAAEEEFTKCADISLATQNASNDVEQKKQVLEDSLQDLVNYKLCLD